MSAPGTSLDDDLVLLEARIKQLKHEYEHYFLGHRPREPLQTRGEVQKLVALWSQRPIQNTAQRFRFRNVCARFTAFKRQWEHQLRMLEQGGGPVRRRRGAARTGAPPPTAPAEPVAPEADVAGEYLAARLACGQSVDRLSRDAVQAQLSKQVAALRAELGVRDVELRVCVENGRAQLKARAVRG